MAELCSFLVRQRNVDRVAHAAVSNRIEDAQAGIQAIHAAGMFSVGIGVQVTSLAPDLSLPSTRELKLATVLDTFSVKKGEVTC